MGGVMAVLCRNGFSVTAEAERWLVGRVSTHTAARLSCLRTELNRLGA